jgi:hypothetical protein
MARISPALVSQVVGTLACILVGPMARPGSAQDLRPAASATSLAASSPTAETVQPTWAVPSWYAGEDPAPTAPRVERGLFETITESICGKPDPDSWRPLSLSTLFSEGWNEAWVPSPNGSGGAPRQGWINAMDGSMYRLWFFTFAEGFIPPPMENRLMV